MRVLTYSLLAGAATALPQQAPAAPEWPWNNIIYHCTQPNTIALTYDDGPFSYGPALLDQLDTAGMNATFFVNGKNWDDINNHRDTIARIANSGHQLGSHTYSHPDLTTLSAPEITSQMTTLDAILFDIIGRRPTYMRAPYLAVNYEVASVLSSLDYKIINVDIDTRDWGFSTGATSTVQALDTVREAVPQGNSIVLMHETNEETVWSLTPQIIDYVRQNGLRAVTVGECLGDAPENWYKYS